MPSNDSPRRRPAAALVEALPSLPRESLHGVEELIALVGPGLLHELLLAFCEESNLGRRRQAFDLLVSLGLAVTPAATALLGDSRWYVLRNMLALLRQVGQGVPPEAVRKGLDHADARVRLEAAKCLVALTPPVPEELLRRGLADDDAKVAEGDGRGDRRRRDRQRA